MTQTIVISQLNPASGVNPTDVFPVIQVDGISPTGYTTRRATGTQLQLEIGGLDVANVKRYGAVGNGLVDDSAAILSAIADAVSKQMIVFFPPGSYKFSVSLDENSATTFQGDTKAGSVCIPLGGSAPCFIINQVAHNPVPFSYSFRDLHFKDPTDQTSCGIWNNCAALDIDRCQFEKLKYGIINNPAEWCRYYRSYFNGCQFAIYATSSNAANDPLGFTSSVVVSIGGTNPSEQYFRDCWFNVCNTAYYEDQPNNPFDLNTDVLFDVCQFIAGDSVVISIGVQQGTISFNKCWFEAKVATPDVVVHGKHIPSSIIYTEGASVLIRDTRCLVADNPIYVKFASGLNSAISWTPRLTIENCSATTTPTITVDEGIISTIVGGRMSATDLSMFTSVRDVNPQSPVDAASTKAVTFPATVWPISQVQGSATGPFLNLWPGGSCSSSVSAIYGAATSAVITTGDGFISNKYLKILGVNNGNGIHTGSFTTVTNKIYFISFGIRQSSGSAKFFLITGNLVPGSGGPGQAGFVTVKSGGWRFFCAITGCSAGVADGDVRILNENGAPVDFDMSAIQVVKFDTVEQAMIYANSGIYTLPVIL